MDIVNGLDEYQSNTAYHEFTLSLEETALRVLALIQEYGSNPSTSALLLVKNFLIEVEKWKASCLQERMGLAESNSDKAIWSALMEATKASNDIDALRIIMQLRGFGSSKDSETGQRRAKVATSVLRFLWPNTWGVVDWRTTVILGLLKKHNLNIELVIQEAKTLKAHELRKTYDIINETEACDVNKKYRKMVSTQLPRAADVDMALFGLSLKVWPMPEMSFDAK